MNNNSEKKAQIRDFIADNLLFSDTGFKYDDDASFLENGIIDSMSIMELVAFIEENFGVEVDDYDITPENFDSINNLAQYILTG